MTSKSSFNRIRGIFRLPLSRWTVRRDLDEELQFHFDSRVANLVAGGCTMDEARRIARQEYGDIDASRRELLELDTRIAKRARRASIADVLRQDIGYALRGLQRSPVLTATIIITLGLGVGANAAVFTVLDRVFLQAPGGVVNPGNIVRLYAHRYSAREPWYLPEGKITPLLDLRDLIDLQNGLRTTAQIEGDYLYRRGRIQPENQRVLVTFVTPGYFNFLGVHAARGRLFLPDENRLSGAATPVVVISDAFWRTHFVSDPAVIGKTVRVDEATYTVIGVAPREFEGLELESIDMWAPLANQEGGLQGVDALRLLARPLNGRDPKLLDRMLTLQFRHTHTGDPRVEDSSSIITAPLLASRAPAKTRFAIPGMPERNLTLLARLAGVGIAVLLIAAANVASLLLMRAMRRRREIAVRIALGISRARLVRQVVTESTLLGLIAGAVALAIAALTGRTLRVALSNGLKWSDAVVDNRVVVFALIIGVVAGMLAGLAPAAFALQGDVGALLKTTPSSGTKSSVEMREALLVTQACLCMALLASAGVFLQSLRRAGDYDRGMDTDRMIQVSISKSHATAEPELGQVEERLRALPDVEAVGRLDAGLNQVPITTKVGLNYQDTIGVGVRGPWLQFVEPQFMRAAGLRLLGGRLFAPPDNFAIVAVLNESLARALWPHGDVLGRCVHVREPNSPCRTVIGVVKDVAWDVTEPSPYRVYVPMAQAWIAPPTFIPNTVIVRMRNAATSADVAELRRVIAPMVSHVAIVSIARASDMLEPLIKPWRLAASLLFAMGALGLLAAATGIYGLVAYDVTQRSRELGVRMALGATTTNVLALVLRSGLRVIAAGIAAGVVVSLISGQMMSSLLFDTSPFDPAVLGLTAVTLIAVAALASVFPAWRASRVDPVIALASE